MKGIVIARATGIVKPEIRLHLSLSMVAIAVVVIGMTWLARPIPETHDVNQEMAMIALMKTRGAAYRRHMMNVDPQQHISILSQADRERVQQCEIEGVCATP